MATTKTPVAVIRAADAVVKSIDDAALANDSYTVSLHVLGKATDVKAVYDELVKRGYGPFIKKTEAYARSFAGKLLALPLARKDNDEQVEFKIQNKTLVSTMLRAYIKAGGSVKMRETFARAGMTQQEAYKIIDEWSRAPKSSAVVVTPPADTEEESQEVAAPTAADLIRNMASIMSGLSKLDATPEDRAAALALAQRLTVWGGVPVQTVPSAA